MWPSERVFLPRRKAEPLNPNKRDDSLRKRQAEGWLRSVLGGYVIRATLVLDVKCNQWLLDRGTQNTNCTSSRVGDCPGASRTDRRISALAPLYFVCENMACAAETDVREFEVIGFVMCLSCYQVPPIGENIKLKWNIRHETIDGIPVGPKTDQAIITRQPKSVVKTSIDKKHIEPLVPNNGAHVTAAALKSHLKNRTFGDNRISEPFHLKMFLVWCKQCASWTEFNWKKITSCNGCENVISTPHFYRMTIGSTNMTTFSFNIICKRCKIESPAKEWGLLDQDKQRCPKCYFNLMTGRHVTLIRQIAPLDFPVHPTIQCNEWFYLVKTIDPSNS